MSKKLVIACPQCNGWDNYDLRTNGVNSYLTHHKTSCPAVTPAPVQPRKKSR